MPGVALSSIGVVPVALAWYPSVWGERGDGMPRLNSAPVRLANSVVARIKQAAAQTGRSTPGEIEARLKESIQRGAWGAVEAELQAKPLALGRLVAFLTNHLTDYSPPGSKSETGR